MFQKKIINVTSKDVVHECETEFGVFPVTAKCAKKIVTKLFDILCNHS